MHPLEKGQCMPKRAVMCPLSAQLEVPTDPLASTTTAQKRWPLPLFCSAIHPENQPLVIFGACCETDTETVAGTGTEAQAVTRTGTGTGTEDSL